MTAPAPDSPSSFSIPFVAPGNLTENVTGNFHCLHGDDVFKYRAYISTYLLVFPVALLGNGGALVAFLFLTRQRSASTVLMTNLALSDAGFSLTLPLRLAYYLRGGSWDFPDWLCRMCVFCFYLNLYTSVFFLTGLSVLRWLAVLRPLHHRSQVTPTRTSLACLGVWLVVGGASTPFLLQGVKERAGLRRCFEPSNPTSWGRVFALNYVALAVGFLPPFLTLLGCYGSVLRHLLSPARQRLSVRRVGRSVRLVSVVTATFLLCFLPYHAARTLHLHAVVGRWSCSATLRLQRALVVTLCLAAANSVVNPLLYYMASSAFRSSVSSAPVWRRWSSSSSSAFWRKGSGAVTLRRGAGPLARTNALTRTQAHALTHT